jgi:deoxycytidylate deaminase
MNHKSHQYLQGCIQSAEKSTMGFRLGAVLVKGGKVLSSGYNHQRPRYEGPGPGRTHCSAVVRHRSSSSPFVTS